MGPTVFMKEVADILLGQDAKGDRFRIKWHGITIRLSIKPISTRVLIKISKELSHVKDIDPSKDFLPEQMANAESLVYICRAIAHATQTRYPRIVTQAIYELPLKDIQALWKIVIKQCDPTSFFFIIVSTKGVNKIAPKKAGSEEERPSSG